MEKFIGQDIADVNMRKIFLTDNADAVVEKTYMKPYSASELQGKKEDLANVSIKIADIEQKKKAAIEGFKGELKPLHEEKNMLVDSIKAKAELVTEQCYRFTDQEDGITGFYNADGALIESRPATADEMQGNLFKINKKSDNKQSKIQAS